MVLADHALQEECGHRQEGVHDAHVGLKVVGHVRNHRHDLLKQLQLPFLPEHLELDVLQKNVERSNAVVVPLGFDAGPLQQHDVALENVHFQLADAHSLALHRVALGPAERVERRQQLWALIQHLMEPVVRAFDQLADLVPALCGWGEFRALCRGLRPHSFGRADELRKFLAGLLRLAL